MQWVRRLMDFPKYVASSKLDHLGYNTAILNGDVAAGLAKLKQDTGGDLLLICGQSLYAQLTRQRLIDEYMLYVCPNAIGQGTHLFRELPEPVKLRPGVTLERYAPIYQK